MKYLSLLALSALVACGGKPDANQINIDGGDLVDGKRIYSGRSGTAITESDLRKLVFNAECKSKGMTLTELKLTPQDDGTNDIYAVCSG